MITNYRIIAGKENILYTFNDYDECIRTVYMMSNWILTNVKTSYTHDVPSVKLVDYVIERKIDEI